jgi:hypothetical protein
LSLEGGIATVKEKSIQTFDASIFTKCSSKWELHTHRAREREQMIHGFFFFLCLSCLLQSTHNVLYDLYCTCLIYRSIHPSSPPAAILIPFLLLDFFFYFFKADVHCLGLQVVGGAAEKERAAETVVGG